MPDPIRAVGKFRAGQLGNVKREGEELTRQYRVAWTRIKSELDGLTAEIKSAQAAGQAISRSWVLKRQRLTGLLGQVEAELGLIADFSARALTQAQADAVLAGRLDAEELIMAGLGPPPLGAFFSPAFPTEAFRELVGFAQDGRPLGDLLAELGPEAAQDMKRALVTGLALGRNPRVVAREARTALGGNLARALTIARTEMLRAYRTASHEMFKANSRVVEGWIWTAALGNRTCSLCWAMHGSLHSLSETLDSHPNCRCAMAPVTKTWEALGFPGVPETRLELEPGPAVFARLDADMQRRILGPGKFKAYRAGRFQLPDLVQTTNSRRWGKGRRVRSLTELLAA